VTAVYVQNGITREENVLSDPESRRRTAFLGFKIRRGVCVVEFTCCVSVNNMPGDKLQSGCCIHPHAVIFPRSP